MAASGKSKAAIAEEKYNSRGSLAWESDYKKVLQKIQKAIELIEAAKVDSFPHLQETK
jgi:hypothetical protein